MKAIYKHDKVILELNDEERELLKDAVSTKLIHTVFGDRERIILIELKCALKSDDEVLDRRYKND